MKRIALAAALAPVMLLVSTLALADYNPKDEQEGKTFEGSSYT